MVMRKMGMAASPVVYLTQDGDTYTYTSESSMKTTKCTFKLGEEFEEETADGRKVKSVMALNGNVLSQDQFGEHPTKIVREFTETECVTTISYNDIVSKRWYKVL